MPVLPRAAATRRGHRPGQSQPSPCLGALVVAAAHVYEQTPADVEDTDVFLAAFALWAGAEPPAVIAALRHVAGDLDYRPRPAE